MPKGEPPSASGPRDSKPPDSSLFLIGKNSRGNWVVQDQDGLYGGLFVNRAEALKYAMFENGHRPQAVIMVPSVLELDLNSRPLAQAAPRARASLARAA
jgi:hypothetical protein